jgi:hypothetical protein
MRQKESLWKTWPFGLAALLIAVLVVVSPISQGYISPGAIIPGTNTYFLQSGATYADWFDLFGTANTFTTTQTIDPSGTGVEGLEIDMPASTTANSFVVEYDGANRVRFYVDADQSYLSLVNVDLGNNVRGPNIEIGRNTNATQSSAGHIELIDKGGTSYYLHADDSGNARFGSTIPTGSADTTNDLLGGTYVGDVEQDFYENTNPTAGTYYTAENYSGSGYLDMVVATRQATEISNVSWTGNDTNVRVTIDGGTAKVWAPNNLGNFALDDVQIGYSPASNSTSTGRRIAVGGARFETTLLIEVMHNATTGYDLQCLSYFRKDQ